MRGQGTKRNLKVLDFHGKERAELKSRLNRSVCSLVDAMCELREAERITGREGLTERVRLAFTDVLMDAARLSRVGNVSNLDTSMSRADGGVDS